MPILPHPRPIPGTTIDAAPVAHVGPVVSGGGSRTPLVVPVRDGVAYDALGPGTALGCHYDYKAQTWRDGHDHSHISTTHPQTAPLYCGTDLDTCAPHTTGGTA